MAADAAPEGSGMSEEDKMAAEWAAALAETKGGSGSSSDGQRRRQPKTLFELLFSN